ncbi:MAG TPA: YlmC/YmxH family sporulation protein [Clostridiaceae bacterium]|nr:YlmC/YmxH family sporulation protein [Clostridiaceae bacterium]
MNRSSEFRNKEVINLSDGRRLGFVSDVEINFIDGRVEAIVIPTSNKIFGIIGSENEILIPWEKIRKIGEDIILVDVDERFLRKYFD